MPGSVTGRLRLEIHLLFREVNLRIQEHTAAWGGVGRSQEPFDYVCECLNCDCVVSVSLTADAFDEIAATQGQYVVAPGHFDGSVEVVERHRDYAVVRVGEQARERAGTH